MSSCNKISSLVKRKAIGFYVNFFIMLCSLLDYYYKYYAFKQNWNCFCVVFLFLKSMLILFVITNFMYFKWLEKSLKVIKEKAFFDLMQYIYTWQCGSKTIYAQVIYESWVYEQKRRGVGNHSFFLFHIKSYYNQHMSVF